MWSSWLFPANRKVPRGHFFWFISTSALTHYLNSAGNPKSKSKYSPPPLICRYYCKKNQRRQQIGRDPSSYLTERFFSTFQIHKQVFLSFLLYYYTTKIIEIQIHSQIKVFCFFFRESTATERDASPNELKVNFLIQNPHQNELEDAKSFRKQEKDVERNYNQHTSISTHASTSIRIHYQLQLCYFLYLAIEKV